MSTAVAKSVAVLEAPVSLTPLLNKARRKPVALSRNGRTAAFLVSARTYEKMAKMIEQMEIAEDRYWGEQAMAALKEGTVGAEEAQKLMDEIKAL